MRAFIEFPSIQRIVAVFFVIDFIIANENKNKTTALDNDEHIFHLISISFGRVACACVCVWVCVISI